MTNMTYKLGESSTVFIEANNKLHRRKSGSVRGGGCDSINKIQAGGIAE